MTRFLILSGLHFACFLLLVFASFDFSAADGGDPALLSRIAALAAGILGQPGIFVESFLDPEHSGAAEWGVAIGNSLLWGAGLSALWILARRGRG